MFILNLWYDCLINLSLCSKLDVWDWGAAWVVNEMTISVQWKESCVARFGIWPRKANPRWARQASVGVSQWGAGLLECFIHGGVHVGTHFLERCLPC